MSFSIDVHVLTSKDDKGLASCLESLSVEPVNVHICEPIAGDIALARKQAYSKGMAPFVCYVDPDDAVVPGIYSVLLNACESYIGAFGLTRIKSNVSGVSLTQPLYPKEWSFEWGATALGRTVAPAFILRRTVVEEVLDRHFDLLPRVWGQDRCIAALASIYGDWKLVNRLGYIWNFTGENISHRYNQQYGAGEFLRRTSPAISEARRLRDVAGRVNDA